MRHKTRARRRRCGERGGRARARGVRRRRRRHATPSSRVFLLVDVSSKARDGDATSIARTFAKRFLTPRCVVRDDDDFKRNGGGRVDAIKKRTVDERDEGEEDASRRFRRGFARGFTTRLRRRRGWMHSSKKRLNARKRRGRNVDENDDDERINDDDRDDQYEHEFWKRKPQTNKRRRKKKKKKKNISASSAAIGHFDRSRRERRTVFCACTIN